MKKHYGVLLGFIIPASAGAVNERSDLMINESSAIVHAAFKGDVQKIEELLSQGVGVNSIDVGGKTPLINAALQSHIELFVLLLEKGADPNAADRQKMTPLIAAILSYANNQDAAQVEQMVYLLIEKGANVNAQNIGGQSALMLAANFGLQAVVERLLKAGADRHMENAFGQKAVDLVNVDCPCHELVR
ncbi:MAG: ankyrin repeat domain-containing protein [Candidatus Babeliales bacterium]